MSIRADLIEIVAAADAAHGADPRPFPERIVDAILERFGVVELAKPSPLNEDDICPDVDPFEFRGPRSAYWAYGGLVEVDIFRRRSPIGTPEQARSEAGALLAAAKRAEAQA